MTKKVGNLSLRTLQDRVVFNKVDSVGFICELFVKVVKRDRSGHFVNFIPYTIIM